jgi:hypothetical protein
MAPIIGRIAASFLQSSENSTNGAKEKEKMIQPHFLTRDARRNKKEKTNERKLRDPS